MLAEAAGTVIAKSIVGQATRALTSRLLARLRGDPVKKAVADALGEAYAFIERRHRAAAASLFDESFLQGRGAPVLARLLVPGDDPTGEDLARAWDEQAPGGRFGRLPDAIVEAGDEFLRVFSAALDSREVLHELRSYRDKRAIVEATRGLLEWAESQRDRAFIDPQLRYGELDFEEVDRFLAAQASGYFVLEGAAGLGKSTFLACLARERDYPVHFVRLAQRADQTAAALSNLVYQLSDRWEIDASLSLQRDVQPHEFSTLLHAISRARTAMGRAAPVVFVIDGLDEVGQSGGGVGNVLGLPGQLPDGVFCLVSMRPVDVGLSVDTRQPCRLTTTKPEQLRDLHEYVIAACERPSIATALTRDGRAERDLIDALMDNSAASGCTRTTS